MRAACDRIADANAVAGADTITFDTAGVFATPQTITLTSGELLITDSVSINGPGANQLAVNVTAEGTPPVINSVSASPNMLKPPNHRLVPVTVSVSDSDNCDPSPVCKIISVTSNQPDNGGGDGDVPNDIQNISGLTVKLRAERCGTLKTGRIYTITVQCKDATGNTSTETTTVTVKK